MEERQVFLLYCSSVTLRGSCMYTAQRMVMTPDKPAPSLQQRSVVPYLATSFCGVLYCLLHMHASLFPCGFMVHTYTGHALGTTYAQKYMSCLCCTQGTKV